MKRKIMLSEEVFDRAERYSIPANEVIGAFEYECSGGYGGLVVITSDGKERHQGCGHPLCSMCEFRQGVGVGDEAIFTNEQSQR